MTLHQLLSDAELINVLYVLYIDLDYAPDVEIDIKDV